MAILAFQKPDKVIMLESDDRLGKFEFRPLEPGYGITIGNALRRILLSSLEGFAITAVKIEGVEHEFSTIKGVVEDVTEIILNLKQIRFKSQIEDAEGEKFSVSISGKKQFVAGDLNNVLANFQVLNPEVVICNMEPSVNLSIEFTIEKGRGYVPAEENKGLNPV
ncbi:MAG: DNA-directed RNA polymerase subunit alpha, partial [Bacteroidales bacterium]|nr:DNA-directed RNA polymerase subunit alpha [Bacteroidales bacterium]